MMPVFDDNILFSFFNPNTLYFWAFWGMLSGIILMKSWKKILRFKYDMETRNWIKKESDDEIISIYNEHIETEKQMKEKYPDWTPLNEFYDKEIRNEYKKRKLKEDKN